MGDSDPRGSNNLTRAQCIERAETWLGRTEEYADEDGYNRYRQSCAIIAMAYINLASVKK